MDKYKYPLFAGLLSVALAAAFLMLLWQPRAATIDELRDDTERVERQQTDERQTIAELEQVRDDEETISAEVAALQATIPNAAQVEEFLDQLQYVADFSLVTLDAMSVSRPSPVDATPPAPVNADETLVVYEMQLQATGDYFEVFEFLSQLEDYEDTPRGFAIQQVQLSEADGDLLNVNVSARAYAVVPTGGEEPEPEEDEDEDDDDDLAVDDLD